MKRTSAEVDLALYAAMFRDVVAWRPDLRKMADRDLLRLSLLGNAALESFLMIDLVETGKIVDKALSRGKINVFRLPGSLGEVTSWSAREFLSGLFELVFEPSDGTLRLDVDASSVYFLRQVLYLAKKVRKDCSNAAIAKEVNDFVAIDRNLRQPTYSWADGDDLGRSKYPRLSFIDGHSREDTMVTDRDLCSRALLRTLDRVCGRLFSKLPVLDVGKLRPSHGPGAVADAKSGADKYLFPTWPDKLEVLFPHNYFARSREDLDITDPIEYSTLEVPARLIAVPKTLKGPRMIASEPTAHQWIQHSLMAWLRQVLPKALRLCVDFQNQGPSRDHCLRASSTGEDATVDLSSASDRLSCWVVERAFQYNGTILDALWACRTRTCTVSVRDSDGVLAGEEDFLLLRKFAPMGSGVTFPVQSLVYAAMAIACVLYDEGSRVSDRNIMSVARRVRVFGDDIILPSSSVSSLDLLLTHCQLKLNASKTHWQGHFRESCGMDAFMGVEVTPLYLRDFQPGQTGEDLVSWVVVSNNAHKAWLINLADYMVERIPEAQRKLIPLSPMMDPLPSLTLTTYSPNPPVIGRTRWNRELQRMEVKALVLSASRTWLARDGYQSLLQYFTEDPSPMINWRSGVIGRQRLRLRKQWVDLHGRNA